MFNTLCAVLLVVVSSCTACAPPPCHWHDADASRAINYFHSVANKVIEADRKEQAFFIEAGSSIKESHEMDYYNLTMALSGGPSQFEVKVTNRVLAVIPGGCAESAVLKVLPTYVNGYGGSYYVDGNTLTLKFPYKYKMSAGGGYTCGPPRQDTGTLMQTSPPTGPTCFGCG